MEELKKDLAILTKCLNSKELTNDALIKLLLKDNDELQRGPVRFAAFASSVAQLIEKIDATMLSSSSSSSFTTTRFTKDSQIMFAMSVSKRTRTVLSIFVC